jgi:hypothetical protein
MIINCALPECDRTAGCAHRGPRGEWCYFGIWGEPNEEVEALRKWLDQHCAPTVGEDGEILSLVGRVKRLIDM